MPPQLYLTVFYVELYTLHEIISK